jgi:hypothetical protein
MQTHLKHLVAFIFLALFGLAALAVGNSTVVAAPVESTLAASVVTQACDPSGSVDGTAEPSTVRPGETITFTARNFRAGEQVSFWFTTPRGSVFGTASPLCCAPSNGVLVFPRIRIPDDFGDEPGRWAMTIAGSSSQHQSIIYFCVVTQAQATATAVPPTATTVPPTATTVPATATTEPATATTVPATATTVPATATTGIPTTVATTPTTVATTVVETATTVATTVVETATAGVPTATAVVVVEETPTVGSTVVGMPSTGHPGDDYLVLLTLLGLVALGLMSTGLAARRTSRVKR